MSPPPAPRPTRITAARVLAAAAALGALLVLGRWGGRYVPEFAERVRGLGAWGPAAFVGGYVVATVAGVPGSLLTLAAGAIFGVWAGVLWVFVGATLGASAAFLVGRYVARAAVERRAAADPRFRALDRAIAADGRRIVFLLRLSPAVPFSVLNYLLGLTRVRFADFVLASAGMLPGTTLYVYYGKVAGDVAAAAGGRAPARGAGYYAVLALGLAATVLVTAIITRLARRALAGATDAPGEGPGAGPLAAEARP
jgi:uncharacterized membrane protein YdjX (TVP38/TMEM64 family)